MIDQQRIELRILAKPNAKRTALTAVSDQGLHIMLHGKPHEGEANKVLIEYLSKLLHVPKSRIVLQRGEGSRHKQVVLPFNQTVKALMMNPDEFITK